MRGSAASSSRCEMLEQDHGLATGFLRGLLCPGQPSIDSSHPCCSAEQCRGCASCSAPCSGTLPLSRFGVEPIALRYAPTPLYSVSHCSVITMFRREVISWIAAQTQCWSGAQLICLTIQSIPAQTKVIVHSCNTVASAVLT